MAACVLILIFLGMLLLDFRKVWKRKGLAAKISYTAILCFAFALSELHVLGFKLIGLNQIIIRLMKLIGLSA